MLCSSHARKMKSNVQEAQIRQAVRIGARVTLEMGESARHITSQHFGGKMYDAKLANMADPRQKLGLYWGYQTRIARTLQELTSGCPFKVAFGLTWPPFPECSRLGGSCRSCLQPVDWGRKKSMAERLMVLQPIIWARI